MNPIAGFSSALRTAPAEASRAAAPPRQETEVAPSASVAARQKPVPNRPTFAAHAVTVDLPDPAPGRLQLSVDGQTGRVVGRIVDRETGETIWQVPSEDMLRLIATTNEMLGPIYSTEA